MVHRWTTGGLSEIFFKTFEIALRVLRHAAPNPSFSENVWYVKGSLLKKFGGWRSLAQYYIARKHAKKHHFWGFYSTPKCRVCSNLFLLPRNFEENVFEQIQCVLSDRRHSHDVSYCFILRIGQFKT